MNKTIPNVPTPIANVNARRVIEQQTRLMSTVKTDFISAFSLVIRGVKIRSRWVYLSVAANRTYIMRTIKNMEKMNNLTQFNLQYNALHSSSFHCHGQQVTVTYYRSCILLFRVLHYSELSSGSMTYYYQDQEVFCLVTPIWRYF